MQTDYHPQTWAFRCFDWSAVEDDYEQDSDRPVGFGATEDEAKDNLREKLYDLTDS